jgi:glutathione S-transferase
LRRQKDGRESIAREDVMQLYSGPLSLFTAKVRIALDEKGLAYDRIDVPFSRERGYEPKHPDVVALNPKAQVPVLVDDGVALYDSTIILEYLEDRYPDPPLFPRDVRERARCRQLEAAADEIFFPPVLELIREVFYKPEPATRDAAKVAAATAELARIYDRLEADLRGREHLCGAFSVADIGWFLTAGFATTLGAAPPASHGHIAGWLGRVASRPSVQRDQDRMRAAMVALASPKAA